jgi:hypothetical protein
MTDTPTVMAKEYRQVLARINVDNCLTPDLTLRGIIGHAFQTQQKYNIRSNVTTVRNVSHTDEGAGHAS